MSIGSVEANFARLVLETTDLFQQVRREAAEASVEEFDRLVDEELHRATSISSEPEVSVKTFMRTIKCNISTLLKKRST
jgi:aryl-alcohol dehydrogenase-like predicted oxidoreductase